MSPEQARGSVADHRADVWAFGVVLYETLTGRRLFEGATVSDTLASVLKTEPDWQVLSSDIPASIRKLLRRCLNKDRSDRLQHIGDARVEIKEALTAPASDETVIPPAAHPTGWRQALPWVAGIVLAVITGIAVWTLTGAAPATPKVTRASITLPAAAGTATNHSRIALAPDGTYLVYAGNDQLYLRAMDQSEATPISQTEGAIEPFFSPDGQSIGFWADGQLKKVSVSGGAPVLLCETFEFFGASWSPDDTIVFSTSHNGISRVSGSGGTPEVIVPVEGEINFVRPQLLPGGEWLLFLEVPSGRIAVQSLVTNERHVLIENGGDVRYLPTGHLVYVRDGTLRAQPFDVEQRVVTPGPVPLVEGVAQGGAIAQFDAADNGTLVYQTGGASRTLVWVDREGSEEPIPAEPGNYGSVQLSPNRERVVIQEAGLASDLVVYDLVRDTPTQLTSDPASDAFPIWTLNGERIVWASDRGGGVFNIVWRAADGTGPVEPLTTGDNVQVPHSWSADGQMLVMLEVREANGDIGVLSIEDDAPIDWLLETDFDENHANVSPDGRWMAFIIGEQGQYEVFVSPFPNVHDRRWQISQDGGVSPRWGPDSRELFFQTSEGAMMVAEIVTEPAFNHAAPVRLFDGPYVIGTPPSPFAFDTSLDGQRFLMIKEQTDATVEGLEVHVVLNWYQELLERVPID
jgi:serine/threonine-protein kinase